MRRRLVAAVAVATPLAVAGTGHASPPTAADSPCTIGTTRDNNGNMTGPISGGPIAQTGTLRCTVQINGDRHSHSDTLVESEPGTGITTMAPRTVTYAHPIGRPAFLCTQFTDSLGTTYYFDNGTGAWTTSSAARCAPAISADTAAITEPLRHVDSFRPGFPPAGFTVTGVAWSYSPGQVVPSFTPPIAAASHPANWTCSTSIVGTLARAVCEPDPGQNDPGTTGWSCYDPFVNVHLASGVNAAGDSVTGRAQCGTTIASCTATTTARTPTATCSHPAFPRQPVPLICEAEFGSAARTASWSVRCAPIDP